MPDLATWNTFYEIVGTAAATLIGLQFIQMTLIAQRPELRAAADAGAAFGTPTIVHFSIALLLSALVVAPWPSILPAAKVWAAVGAGGMVYALIVTRRMRRQTAYAPVFEDWVFHAVLPLLAYATLAIAAGATPFHVREAMFGIAASALLMLLIGIHNVWDSVTYQIYDRRSDSR